MEAPIATLYSDLVLAQVPLPEDPPIKTFEYGSLAQASGMNIRQIVKLKQGLDKENATKINKLIKSQKLKVQSQIQGDQLRVTAKKIDDLQKVIQIIKDENLKKPIEEMKIHEKVSSSMTCHLGLFSMLRKFRFVNLFFSLMKLIM